MKKRALLNLAVILLIVFLPSFDGFSQQNSLAIQLNQDDPQGSFAVGEIKEAAFNKGYSVSMVKSGSNRPGYKTVIKIISDSVIAAKTVKAEGIEPPPTFKWQCYSIRIIKKDGTSILYVLAGDKTGAMYGGLDIAESIKLGNLDGIRDSDHKPYIERRGIKYNIPLDLRTPSYSDPGDAAQNNIPVVWDMDFWQQQLDEMALHRYNVLSLWNLNPFPSIVKIPEFPEIALNDVWRTKATLDENFNHNGRGFLRPEMLSNYEVVKKMTINEKIAFWRNVMEYAHNRGIEVYLFTWNIFTYGVDGKYGIDDRQNNDTTIAYFRNAVRETILTYPNLDGIGITAGENMQGNRSKYSNEEWLWKTYGEGVRDALKQQPERKIRLIHRFHGSSFETIMKEFRNFEGTFDLSYKYSIAHMYAVPDPPYIKSYMHLFSPKLKTWLTVRNDDIYSFRWGNPDFARQYILAIPELQNIVGFYMGPDGYNWGRDFLGKDNISPRPLIIQKQWYSFMLWGRLSYDPGISNDLFLKTIQDHIKEIPAETLMNGWSAASMIFPWVTRFSWGDIDIKWFPEACISDKGFKGFYTVKDFMEVEPQPGSDISNVIRWAQNYRYGKPDSLLSPLDAADTISKYSRLAQMSLQLIERNPGAPDELNQTLGDIAAFATIGNYYSEKIRGACSLALYNFYGLEQDKDEAVQHLQNAKTWWAKYASIYDSQYKPALFNRIGFINMPELIQKTEQDIQIAREWQPGTIKEYKQGKIIFP